MSDWIAFASLVPAGVAATLLLAASGAMGVALDWESAALAAAGTLVVYNFDRLRDLDADRAPSPLRTAFIERQRSAVVALTAAAGAGAAVLALRASREVLWICGAVLALGLLHRRLKRLDAWKALYVTASWVAVTAGIPAVSVLSTDSRGDPLATLWVGGVYSTAIGANLLASGLRGAAAPYTLRAAQALAAVGTAAALLGPEGVRPLACVAGAEVLALLGFRPGERYGLLVVDGALLAGALLALAIAA